MPPVKNRAPDIELPFSEQQVTYQDFFDLFEVVKVLVDRVNIMEEIIMDKFPGTDRKLGEPTTEQYEEESEEDELVDLTNEPDLEFRDYDPSVYFV